MPKTKQVTVTVDTAGEVVCTPSTTTVNGGSNFLVTFKLQTPGYVFPGTDAVVVTNPGNQFPYGSWTTNPTTASIYDANTQAGDYPYTVTVINTSTGGQHSMDPLIKNEA